MQFKVKNGSVASEVTNVHEAGAAEVEDVVEEREMRGLFQLRLLCIVLQDLLICWTYSFVMTILTSHRPMQSGPLS